MTLLATVWDARLGYDDTAAEARALARAAGWGTASVFVTPVGSRAAGTTASGERWVRVAPPAPPARPAAQQQKALADRLYVLDAERRELEAGGAGRADRRRLRLVAEGKALRRVMERAREQELPRADVLAGLDLVEAYADALEPEVAALGATALLASGPVALVVAARLGLPTAYVPGPLPQRVAEGARDEVLTVLERRWAGRATRVRDDLPAALHGLGVPAAPAPEEEEEEERRAEGVRLGIGPANFAGQGWAWAESVRRELGAQVDVVAVQRASFAFPADVTPTEDEWASLDWQREWLPRPLSWTHALSESLRPLLGLLNGSVISGDLAALRRAGVSVAVLCHGSEVRSPRAAGALYEHAPYGPEHADVARLQETSDRNVRLLGGVGGPVFVATPDLLDSVPFAEWLPIVVAEEDFAVAPPVLERAVPVVVHAPTNPRWKGTDAIEPVLLRLQDEGLLEYRRYGTLPPPEVPAALREADVLIDHVVLGNYATLSIQAMAAGRLVLGHVHARVRRRLPLPVPVLETTPDTVEQVLRAALADRAGSAALAAQGPAFARALHDGRVSARVLGRWLTR
ncbi:hypothetical protein EV189_2000 [Motilibacter rhizosphaerae]|uniref:Glycosyltransferase involved in cell wall biosynthesis n=1 Tax=Motilibacter rhizosphaerae TaxID=598652 RepID=A0A4Q7NSU1_9ACTN|nr:hypothetical protein [Motilibacter rhizosphaerae]RZS90216.1 hypothetical protein EV189_2000 [Motilibacter rhizosphaerae]